MGDYVRAPSLRIPGHTGAVDRNTLIWIALVLAVLLVVTDFTQLFWFGRRANPDHGPMRREDWEQTTARAVTPGDVILSSRLSPKPETVVEVTAVDEATVAFRFRSGRTRTTPASTPLRRHRHPSAGPPQG